MSVKNMLMQRIRDSLRTRGRLPTELKVTHAELYQLLHECTHLSGDICLLESGDHKFQGVPLTLVDAPLASADE